jgi:hypothetical protein
MLATASGVDVGVSASANVLSPRFHIRNDGHVVESAGSANGHAEGDAATSSQIECGLISDAPGNGHDPIPAASFDVVMFELANGRDVGIPPAPADITDPEIRALALIVTELDRLDSKQRARVLCFCSSRFGMR